VDRILPFGMHRRLERAGEAGRGVPVQPPPEPGAGTERRASLGRRDRGSIVPRAARRGVARPRLHPPSRLATGPGAL